MHSFEPLAKHKKTLKHLEVKQEKGSLIILTTYII